MDDFKLRATEKFEAFHLAARSAAGNGSSKVQNVYNQTSEAINKIRQIFDEIWHHELIVESRERVMVFTNETIRRIKEGAPLLSPVLLYEEIVALFKDRVWRRSMLIFCLGCGCGICMGLVVGLRWSRSPTGPACRALHAACDGSVLLVEDDTVPGAGAGEVLVRVQAFSVSGVDRAVLRGHGAALRALLTSSHVTVGRGFSGVILDAGQGVDSLELGDEVWGCVSEWNSGAATELLVISSSRVCKRPRGMAADTAASLPWAGAKALTALHKLNYSQHTVYNKRICVCGAASGEGCTLIQLLSSWGAKVCTAAPSHHQLQLKDLGGTEMIDLDSKPNALPANGANWSSLEQIGAKSGPWDSVVICSGLGSPAGHPRPSAILKSLAEDLFLSSEDEERTPLSPKPKKRKTNNAEQRCEQPQHAQHSRSNTIKGVDHQEKSRSKSMKISTAPRGAVVDLRPRAFLSDRLPVPFTFIFSASFYFFRTIRYICGLGTHTDWMEDQYTLASGLHQLTLMVETGQVKPTLDKVFIPQEFEAALAHACSEDALGTTVIRFP